MSVTLNRLDGLRFQRSYWDERDIALWTLDCVLLGGKGIYASSALTSGRRAQQLQREHGIPNNVSLRDHFDAERYELLLWNPNASAAVAFAAELHTRLGATDVVISPAPFKALGWPQEAYLDFWETLLRTRIKGVYFNDDWEYSNGCVYEFVVATEVGLETRDRAGITLSPDQGADRIVGAVRDLEAQGLDASVISSHLERLTQGP